MCVQEKLHTKRSKTESGPGVEVSVQVCASTCCVHGVQLNFRNGYGDWLRKKRL